MGNVEFHRTGSIDPKDTGAVKRIVELEDADVTKLLDWIKEQHKIGSSQLFIYCYGKQSSRGFADLKTRYPVEIYWHQSILSGWLRMLNGLIASQAGFIRVLDSSNLADVVHSIGNRTMLALVLIDNTTSDEFKLYMNTGRAESDPENAVQYSSTASVYVLDFDNSESSTGTLLVSITGPSALHGPEIGQPPTAH